jgi:hypothetical protein
MKYLVGVLLPLSFFLAACSSQFPLVKPGKIHQRYFPNTEKVLVYSIAPPSGPWRYIEPKYHATGNIAFIGRVGPYVSADVGFKLIELLIKFDDGDVIEQNKVFFRTGKFIGMDAKPPATLITIGSQGIRCIKNSSPWQQHFGPSRDPEVSGKWAGQGSTRISYQIWCPFHMNGRHFELVMDKSFIVADAITMEGQDIDVKAINAEIDRQFEPVWKSIVFNPALSQAALP